MYVGIGIGGVVVIVSPFSGMGYGIVNCGIVEGVVPRCAVEGDVYVRAGVPITYV